MVNKNIQYYTHKIFFESLRNLYQRGGALQKAANAVYQVHGKIKDNSIDPFEGMKLTKHGESRIKYCLKYDLTDYARLITIQSNKLIIFCFVGDHNDCDKWLNSNKGLEISLDNQSLIIPVYISQDINVAEKRIHTETDFALGKLFLKIPEAYYSKIKNKVTFNILVKFEELESISSEDEIINISLEITDTDIQSLFFDVFSLLKESKIEEAKNRIDLFTDKLELVEVANENEINNIESNDYFVNFADFEPEDLKHIIETQSFQQFMLFLHPEQRKIVDTDFNGPAKLSGISGSGKTAIIVKRAIRLSKKYPLEKILILTLNKSLAQLIKNLIKYAIKDNFEFKKNIEVMSFWELCRKKLLSIEPNNEKMYDEFTWKTLEHITDVWNEFYHCEENNNDAEVLLPVHKSLLSRTIFPKVYIKEEFDWIRSAFIVNDRIKYLDENREGRATALDKNFRESLLTGLDSWERKMEFVGVIDYLGLTNRLHYHMDEIEPEYRCILVDEVQDFGTLELQIIRKLANENENDIYLCGDIAQQVCTKHQKFNMAGINVLGRSRTIKKNYRNSKEILLAAYNVLKENVSEDFFKVQEDFIHEPEYSNFSTPKPLILNANDLKEEIGYSLNYLRKNLSFGKKACIAVCGYSIEDIKDIADQLKITVLDGVRTDIDSVEIFISDLEQTKGFEFDKVCILNCKEGVLPNPNYPKEEWYREITKFYVAMTRAKLELIISYSGKISTLIQKSINYFNTEDSWNIHEKNNSIEDFVLKNPSIQKYENDFLKMTGSEFLYTQKAVGISLQLQNKMEQLIQGKEVYTNHKQEEWKNIGEALSFRDIPQINRLFGPVVYQEFKDLFKN